ncbi:hypothetical protein [Megalodesulfovibrio paquesii]
MITIFDAYFAYTACVACLDFFVRIYLYQRAGASFHQLQYVEVRYWRDIPLRVTARAAERAPDVVGAHQLCLFLEALLVPLFLIAILASSMH